MISSIVGQLLLGWLLADLLTGLFHWWEDRFGREDWALIGPWLIAPNRLHHVDALAFTRHGFAGRNGASIAAAGMVGCAWWWLLGPSLLMASALFGAALTNEVHRFAHQPSAATPIIRMLHQTGLLQSPKGHAAHHRPPQTANYCVLTDWLNPLLEFAGIWSRLERLAGRS